MNKLSLRTLFRRLCEATFAVTPSTRPEHTLLARQNRCPQGFCKCSGAAISHFVPLQVQCGEGGVCLVIFHRTHACAQVAARVLSHTTAPRWAKFCLHENDCEDTRDVCATGSPVTLCGYVERQYKFAFMFWSEVNQ